jgi:hypothetical protein
MANATDTLIKKLPPWAAGLISVAIIGGIGFTAYMIYRKVKQMKADKASKKEVSDINDDIKKLQKTGIKQTLSASEIASIANNLFTAMDGYGTNYDMILKNMVRVNNQIDLLAVINSYGVRELSSGKGNPAPNLRGTLGQAFADELSSDEMNAVNMMLARKGIKQRF